MPRPFLPGGLPAAGGGAGGGGPDGGLSRLRVGVLLRLPGPTAPGENLPGPPQPTGPGEQVRETGQENQGLEPESRTGGGTLDYCGVLLNTL